MPDDPLIRPVFRTSREADFAGVKDLTAQIGHEVDDWPLVIAKELSDNALDSCEEHGIAPEIAVTVSENEIIVADNGAGIPAKIVEDLLDFSTRVSSREAYVSPSRGQQGNALKVLIAMPYALSEGATDRDGGWLTIESQGTAHRIAYDIDPVRRTAKPDYRRTPSEVQNGSRITVHFPPGACHLLADSSDAIARIVRGFGWFNPHLAVNFRGQDGWENLTAYDPDWEKWTGKDPTSPHWYDQERFERLIGAVVGDDEDKGRKCSVREFVGTFAGLSRSEKKKEVMDLAGLAPMPLAQLFAGGHVAHDVIGHLLAAMQDCSPPINPERLGPIGQEAFRATFEAYEGTIPESFRYKRVSGTDGDSIPFIVEAAFITFATEQPGAQLYSAVNWSPTIDPSPFRFGRRRLSDLLLHRSIYSTSPICIVLHLISPRPQFVDRGKSTIAVSDEIEQAFIRAIHIVTANWARSEEAQERAERREVDAALRRQRQAIIKPRRPKNEIVGTGSLHQEIAEAAALSGYSIAELTVLSRDIDPYGFDTTLGHAAGKWFADQVEALVEPTARIHLRGLFYRIVARGGIIRPDGQAFINTAENWYWLSDYAAKAARWLRYTPFSRVRDERNAAPFLRLPDAPPGPGLGSFVLGGDLEIPELDALLPRLKVDPPRGVQPYRIVLIGEKSSLVDVLLPVAEIVQGELLLPSGESSDSTINEAVERAAEDGRPAVFLYFADFDPSGHQMPISISRKIQAMRRLLHPDLRADVHRVALTISQVLQYKLPDNPIKPSETRRGPWLAAFGHEQVEIDALASLAPDTLRQIALDAVKPFFDFTLQERCVAAADAWYEDAVRRIDNHPAREVLRNKLAAAHRRLVRAAGNLHRVRDGGFADLKVEVGIEDTSIDAPEAEITVPAPTPLFTTDDDFVTASRKLAAEKKYEFENENEDETDDR